MSGEPQTPPEGRSLATGWRGPSVARATYGLIVTMSVLAVWSEEHDPSAAEVLESLVGTVVVFWLAHTYSAILEETIRVKQQLSRGQMRAVVAHEWPLVEVAVAPTLIVAFGVIDSIRTATVIDIALYVCLAELAATGALAAWRSGARGVRLVVTGGVGLALGLVIVVLKTLIH